MLHNSGPYGPNEAPINSETPVNYKPISTPMNLVQNLDNLDKNVQQPAQTEGEHYNLPGYSLYRPPTLNVPTQMSPFHNYQTATLQPNYLVENTELSNTSNWQNGMYPTHMNTQTNIRSTTSNYPVNYEKEIQNSVMNKEIQNSVMNQDFESQMVYQKSLPINIPQVPMRPFLSVNNDASYSLYNVNKDKFSNYNNSLDLKGDEKPLLDNNKRKSLENTVRLIENILENTKKNRELEKEATDMGKHKKTINKDIFKPKDDFKQNQDSTNTIKTVDISENSTEKHSKSKCESLIQPEDLIQATNSSSNKTNEVLDEDVKISMEAPKETENTKLFEAVQVKVENEDEATIVVKVEQMNWMDSEFGNPFHRDPNGITREDLGDRVFIDGDSSVEVATSDIKNAITSNSYYECPHCNLCFDQPKRFLIHYKWHSFGTSNNKRTDIFKKKELKRIQTKAKEEETSLKEDDEPKKFPCKDCNETFLSKSSLKNHRLRIHSNHLRECKLCDKKIYGYMAYKTHRASHNRKKEASFQCPDCNKIFRHKHTLAKHRDTHLEKTVACEQCPKKFGSVKQLKIHMKVHERAERGPSHQCKICTKSFYEVYNLQVHERVHRNERPFVCEICNTGFVTNSSLKRHIKVSHSSQKPFECSHCHRCFLSEKTRDCHEARMHGDTDLLKFVCDLCDSRYLREKDLQKHMHKVHSKPKRKKLKKVSNNDNDSE